MQAEWGGGAGGGVEGTNLKFRRKVDAYTPTIMFIYVKYGTVNVYD